MKMPKAAMNEDHFAAAWEYNIGLSRKRLNVLAETIALPMKGRAKRDFWLCILTANTSHVRAAALGGNFVRHRSRSTP